MLDGEGTIKEKTPNNMTIRVSKQACYAKTQNTKGTAATPDAEGLIPITSDISKTFIEDNSVERPELKPTFGANDSVIISETQGISIPSFVQGGGVSTSGKNPVKLPPVDPLLLACFHGFAKINSAGESTKVDDDTKALRYTPTDDDPTNGGATVLYQIDGIQQVMTDALGTMTLNIEVGGFASMTFEMQSPYADPVAATDLGQPSGKFQEVLAVSGATSLRVPGLPAEFADCVRSFSLTQGATVSAVDCATKAGNRKITYTQTGRSATGEIVVDISKEGDLGKLVKAWGGKKALSAPVTLSSPGTTGLVVLGTKAGNRLSVGINNFKIGAPTAGDQDGIATWTFPITCLPIDNKPDYELVYS